MGFKFSGRTDKKMTSHFGVFLPRALRSEKGQSVILVAMMILSFLMFFGFVVNTGLLVAAKISVQAAADAAAYAGAATQARQLNAISYLNYDMREQYKKFVYRYVFVGNIGNSGFPLPPPNSPPATALATNGNPPPAGYYSFWKKDSRSVSSGGNGTPIAQLMNVPIVCIPLTLSGKANDNCLQINVASNTQDLMKKYPPGSVDAIGNQLLSFATTIDQTLQNNCAKQGAVNVGVLTSWLFRGDNSVSALDTIVSSMTGLTADEKAQATTTIGQLVDGLGLYPRNIITSMRIGTLEKFLNEPPATGVTSDQEASWEKSPQAETHERTILAFKSALANINNEVMDHSLVTMTELQSATQISTTPLLVNFNAYVQQTLDASANTGTTICNAAILPFVAINAPVGVKKADGFSGIVHYAVKVTAQAKLMFLPGKNATIDLDAIAGAKPFGSRIGPANETEADFTESITPNPLVVNDGSGAAAYKVPNLKLDGTNTFYSTVYLNEILTKARGGSTTFGFDGLLRGQIDAMAPNPVEVGHYNILPPAKASSSSSTGPLADMKYEFIPYSDDAVASADATKGGSIYRFYAPLYPSGESNVPQVINQFLDAMFQHTSVGTNALGINVADLRSQIFNTLTQYISGKLTAGTGTELNESLTFAAVQLPIQKTPIYGVTPSATNMWLTEANQVLSSWGPDQGRLSDTTYGLMPRFGYSVKFVTLQELVAAGMPASDEDVNNVNH
jgi:hypothetical protein